MIKRFRLIAGIAGALWIGLEVWFGPFSSMANSALIVSGIAYALAFIVWFWNSLGKRLWGSAVGKLLYSVVPVFIAPSAVAWSREIVAKEIGLPPQDFDLTVSFLSIFTFIMLVTSLIAILVGLFGGATVFFSELASSFGLDGADTVAMRGCEALFLGWVCIVVVVFPLNTFAKSSVRWLAFYCDYQSARNYPGVGPRERIRLHENGVISSAVMEGGQVKIGVRIYGNQVPTSHNTSVPSSALRRAVY